MSFRDSCSPATEDSAPSCASSSPPLITVAIPSYNRPDLLRQALASIAAQRDFTRYEVVVCDDGGLPETKAVIAECGLRNLRFIVNRVRIGPVANWNRCIAEARADWVTILHEDDVLYPWFFRLVASRLRDGVAGVAVRCVQGDMPPALAEPGRRMTVVEFSPVAFLKSSMTPFPGVVFSRAAARRIGGFNALEGGIADYAFWYDLVGTGRIEVIRETAAFYRLGPGQWTNREWPRMLRRAHLLRLRIAREQLGARSRTGRWIARFYSARMARSYAERFSQTPAVLRRVERFNTMAFAGIPSGWVSAWLKFLARQNPPERNVETSEPAFAV